MSRDVRDALLFVRDIVVLGACGVAVCLGMMALYYAAGGR